MPAGAGALLSAMKRFSAARWMLLVLASPLALPAQELSLFGSVSQEAREITSASLAQPLAPAAWQGTLAQRRALANQPARRARA